MVEIPGLEPYDRPEREFLHDLSNPLAIAYGNLRILVAKMEDGETSLDSDTILVKLNKVITSFEKANKLLDMRRAFLKNSDLA